MSRPPTTDDMAAAIVEAWNSSGEDPYADTMLIVIAFELHRIANALSKGGLS